jgi:hypothetical protein
LGTAEFKPGVIFQIFSNKAVPYILQVDFVKLWRHGGGLDERFCFVGSDQSSSLGAFVWNGRLASSDDEAYALNLAQRLTEVCLLLI